MNQKKLTSEIGEQIIGPYLVSFCQWLYRQKELLHLDLLVFTARDGFLLQRIYNILFPNESSQYIRLSRKALRLPYLYKCSSYKDYLNIIPLFQKISIGDLGNSLVMVPAKLEKFYDEFDLDYTVKRKNLKNNKALSEAFNFIRNLNRKEGIEQEELLIKYLRHCKIDQKFKIGFVDYSFKGTSQYMLEKILAGNLKIEIRGLYFHCNKLAKRRLQDRGFSFLENCISEMDLLFIEKALIIERIMLEPVGSTIGYKLCKDGKVIPIIEEYREHGNDEIVKAIQNAILKYAYEVRKQNLDIDLQTAVRRVLKLIKHPTREMAELLGKLEDDNILKRNIPFAKTRNFMQYVRNPSLFFKDLRNGLWRQAFLRQFPLGNILKEIYNCIFTIVYFLKN